MRKKFLLSVLGVVWFLCLGLMARGITTITITGPATMCAGNSGSYFISPTAGIHYQWAVTAEGTITGPSTNPSVGVLWGGIGTATVTVDGYDSSNTLQQVGTLTVMVAPIPAPYITADKIAGCQNFADTPTRGGEKGGSTPGDPHILDDGSGCPKVCDSSIVTYTGYGPPGSTFGWTVTGGTIIGTTANTCTVFWNGPVGYGSITVSDTSVYGCVGTKTICISIIEKPHASFLGVTNICINQPAIFIDNSTASPTSPIINWFWDFGDGSTFTSATSSTVTHTYTTAGPETVTLVVRNQCGCTDTFRMSVTINPSQGVTIVCPGVVCDSTTASYSLSPSVACGTYSWHVQGGIITSGAGTSSITVQWTNVDTTGFGYVAFDASSCAIACPSTTIIKVPVITPHGHIFGPKTVCPFTQYLYNLPQWPTTLFTWSVLTTTGATLWPTDQNNQIALNTHGPGVIVLKCVYENTLLGCGGIAYDTIRVESPDSILGPIEQCFGSIGNYTLASGATGDWTLTYPDLSTYTNTTNLLTATFSQVGTYELDVTGNFCLSHPLSIRVDSLPPAPDSLLGLDTTCFGVPVTYIAKNNLPGSIFGWSAITGSPSTYNGDHYTVTLSGASPATIMVWRESSDGAHCRSAAISKLVYKPYVNPHVTGTDTVCPNTVYAYDAGYYKGEVYHWSVYNPLNGSVQTDGLTTSQILFNNIPGPVDVIVTVTKCSTTYSDTMHVYVRSLGAPSITITPNPVCRDQPFTASVSGISSGTVDWDWGDGTTHGSGFSAIHAYHDLLGTSFTHTVVCTVTNPFGCVAVITQSQVVTELPAPVANVTPDGPFVSCAHPSQPITATLTAGYEPTSTLIWENAATGVITSCGSPFLCNPHLVTNYGVYYVIAVGANGCRDTSNRVEFDTCQIVPPCVIAGSPYATINIATVNCGVVHLGGTYASFPTAFSWSWQWPTQALGVTTTNTTLYCNFNLAGNYHFRYIVGFTDISNDTCYFFGDTTITVPFIAGMGHSVACSGSGYNVTMFDHSNYVPGHAPYSYSWYVDGIHQATTGTSSYTAFLAPGTHILNEWTYYGPGTLDSCEATDTVVLDPLPVASFSFMRDTTCAILAAVQFTNLSTPLTPPLSYMWSFGDGPEGNTQTNPWKVYSSGGIYPVTLTVTNRYNCTSSFTLPVNIINPDLAGTIGDDSVACAGSVITLIYHNTGSNSPEHYYWMDGSDSMYMTLVNTTNVYTAGSYWVIGTDHFGCYVPYPSAPMAHLNVNLINPPPAIISGDTSQCLNVSYTLNGYAGSDPAIGYTWLRNGVPVSSGPSYTDAAATTGSFTYQLIITLPNPLGGFCADTSAPFIVTVHAQPGPPTIGYSMIDCNTYTVKLSAGGPTSGFYNWSNSMSGQTIVVPEGGGPYKVWYTDTFGCTSSTTAVVPRDPRLYLWVFPSGCYDFCKASLPRTIVGPIEPFNYWGYLEDPTLIVESGTFSPVGSYAISGAGDYQLILANALCRDTSDMMDVTVDPTCVGCKQVMFTPLKVYQTHCDPLPPADGRTTATAPDTCCHDYIIIRFTNSGPSPIGVSLTATSGYLAPSGTISIVGTMIDTFQFIPDPGFAGGSVVITITYTDPKTGIVYTCTQKITVPICNPANGGRSSDDDETIGGQTTIAPDGMSVIKLVPNPAQNSTRVDYQFTGDAAGAYIEVYDMMGRQIAKHPVTQNEGSVILQLENVTSGIYQVVLRQNGRPILQSRLSVIH